MVAMEKCIVSLFVFLSISVWMILNLGQAVDLSKSQRGNWN
jgi:hypothetical protein